MRFQLLPFNLPPLTRRKKKRSAQPARRMPAKTKRVRFAANSTVHELPSQLPIHSPQLSATSNESATPQRRPRVLQRPTAHRTTLPHRPYDNVYAVPLQLHSALSSASTRIKYNCAQPPSTATTISRGISPHFYAEPATNLPVSSISIRSPHLPWKITIRATRHGMVTISDVLNTIYQTLRESIHLADFELLSASDKKRVRRSYQERYRSLRGSSFREAAEEKRQGVRKVDFLMGKTRFMGLANTTNPTVWSLITS